MRAAMLVGASGFGLIAVCYGFARFAFGLFLPQISADLELSSTLSGAISAGSFIGFCLAIVAAAWLTERFGPRAVAMAAGVIAAAGMVGIAAAASPVWLAVAVIVAGSSAGLASPPLAAAVAAQIDRARQDTTNTAINAGTSAGVALSGPVAIAMGAGWRVAFACFAGAAAAMALATLATLAGNGKRAGSGTGKETKAAARLTLSPDLVRLAAAACLTGAASTVVWTFGAELTAANLDWDASEIGILWIVMGCAGLVGATSGWLIARAGLNAVHLGFHIALAASLAAVGHSHGGPLSALAGGAAFGASYLMLTGVYLVWGIAALPGRPAAGVMVAFLALAVGQALGASAFGVIMEHTSPNIAVLGFALLALAAGLVRRRSPARRAMEIRA